MLSKYHSLVSPWHVPYNDQLPQRAKQEKLVRVHMERLEELTSGNFDRRHCLLFVAATALALGTND